MTKDECVRIVRDALCADPRVKYAFLFGSVLKTLRRDSDIDVLVGGDIDSDATVELTVRLEKALKRHVDLVSAGSARPEVVLKAMARGLRVFVRDMESLKCDYFRVYRAYDDTTSLRRIKAAHFKRLYANG